MAFTYAIKKDTVIGDLRAVYGTYESADSSTGGAIVTGLNEVLYFNTDCEASQAGTVNLVAISGGTVTITTVANETGKWEAIGV
jgi:hypothetical protein